MKKRICLVLLIVMLMTTLSACGRKYVCSECNRVTKKAYYTYAFDENELLCEECAREYWMPYNYESFQVKKATTKDLDNIDFPQTQENSALPEKYETVAHSVEIPAADTSVTDTPATDPFDDYDEVGAFDEHAMTIAKKDGYYGWVDRYGNVAIDFIFKSVSEFDDDGMALVNGAGNYGWIDRKGNTVISCIYDAANRFDAQDMAMVKQNGYYGWIDREGNVVIPLQFTDAENFDGNYAKVCANRWGVIDRSGKYLVEPVYREIHLLDDYIEMRDTNNYWGLMNYSGEFLIEPAYPQYGRFVITNRYIFAAKETVGTRYIPYDKDGNYLLPDGVDGCTLPQNGGCIAYGAYDHHYLLDDEFNYLQNSGFDHATEFNSFGYSIVKETSNSKESLVFDVSGDLLYIVPNSSGSFGFYHAVNEYFAINSHCITDLRTDEIYRYAWVDEVPDTNCIIVKYQDTGLYGLYDGEEIVESGYTNIKYEGTSIILYQGNSATKYIPVN